jgi:hypothetical protein
MGEAYNHHEYTRFEHKTPRQKFAWALHEFHADKKGSYEVGAGAYDVTQVLTLIKDLRNEDELNEWPSYFDTEGVKGKVSLPGTADSPITVFLPATPREFYSMLFLYVRDRDQFKPENYPFVQLKTPDAPMGEKKSVDSAAQALLKTVLKVKRAKHPDELTALYTNYGGPNMGIHKLYPVEALAQIQQSKNSDVLNLFDLVNERGMKLFGQWKKDMRYQKHLFPFAKSVGQFYFMTLRETGQLVRLQEKTDQAFEFVEQLYAMWIRKLSREKAIALVEMDFGQLLDQGNAIPESAKERFADLKIRLISIANQKRKRGKPGENID